MVHYGVSVWQDYYRFGNSDSITNTITIWQAWILIDSWSDETASRTLVSRDGSGIKSSSGYAVGSIDDGPVSCG